MKGYAVDDTSCQPQRTRSSSFLKVARWAGEISYALLSVTPQCLCHSLHQRAAYDGQALNSGNDCKFSSMTLFLPTGPISSWQRIFTVFSFPTCGLQAFFQILETIVSWDMSRVIWTISFQISRNKRNDRWHKHGYTEGIWRKKSKSY